MTCVHLRIIASDMGLGIVLNSIQEVALQQFLLKHHDN
eukprot:CAMPEP_0179470992 /NCGR_PEP_ID=MMETSP0799-20121207/51315_1 /TAXON_ID=46947 /ORGANISM="Geminigera cryophila, Strain CCMP2564" /LENGTH=37 /DNA_ID= /DNA_START= /DNA_END= /DNA_ORIENTATION=